MRKDAGGVFFFFLLRFLGDFFAIYTTFIDWIKAVTYPRIGKIEAMAQYFGCEKSDLIEDKKDQPIRNDGLSDVQHTLIQFACSLSDEQATHALQILKLVLGDKQ